MAWDRLEELFAGSVTVGERGQVVIPAQVRSEFGIQAGEKLLVFRHPAKIGLMFVRVDAMDEFVTFAAEGLAKRRRRIKQTRETREDSK